MNEEVDTTCSGGIDFPCLRVVIRLRSIPEYILMSTQLIEHIEEKFRIRKLKERLSNLSQ